MSDLLKVLSRIPKLDIYILYYTDSVSLIFLIHIGF